MAASCTQTPALPHQEWTQDRPPPLYNKTGPPTMTFYFLQRSNRTIGIPTILLPDNHILCHLVQSEKIQWTYIRIYIDVYTLQERMHFFITSIFTKKSCKVCKYVDINQIIIYNVIISSWNRSFEIWTTFNTHYHSVGIRLFLCICSDNLGKSNNFSSEFYKNNINWLIPGGNGGDVAGI